MPLPAPETDEDDYEGAEERAPSPAVPRKEKKTEAKKRLIDSEEDEDEPHPVKKHKKEKGKEGGKHRREKEEESKKKKVKKDKKNETSEDETAALGEDDLSDGPSESQMDDASSDTATRSSEKSHTTDKIKHKKGKWEVKLQGIKDLIHDKKARKSDAAQKDSSSQKFKSSKSKEETAPLSDSSDSSTLHKKSKSKGQEGAGAAPPKVPSSTSSSSSSSSIAAASTKGREDEAPKEEMLGPKDTTGSTNLFEKFLLNCEAKDRAPRRPLAHQPAQEKSSSKATKVQ